MTFTTEITIEVEVTADYDPGEPMVRYYRNGDGHPGSDPSAEIQSIRLGNIEISDELGDQMAELTKEAFEKFQTMEMDV